MKKVILTLIMLTVSINLFAQNTAVEMADILRSNGKIYVVVAVILIILLGLLAYLFSLDRKIKMLEKKSNLKN